MNQMNKNYTDCEKCPDGIYKNEDQNGFVFCDRCDHKIRRDGESVQDRSYSLDSLAGAVTIGDDDPQGGFQ